MKRITMLLGASGILLFVVSFAGHAQRGGRGAVAAGGARGHAVVGPYGGSSVGARSGGTVIGPAGGSRSVGSGQGTITTPGGSTIRYGGAAAGGTTPGGVQGGRYVGGVQVTTPGGQQVTKVGRGGGAVGPAGNAVGGRSSVGVSTGPGGTAVGVSGGRAAVGPGGAVGSRYAGGVAVGPAGAIAGGRRGVAAVGPGGAVAAGGRAVATAHGTYYRSAAVLRTQGVYVRRGFVHANYFTPAWYARYPGAWLATGWAAGTAWRAATWGSVASYCGYPSQPVYCNYGDTIVYEGDTVYVDGDRRASADEYAQQAAAIADAGREARPGREDEWQPLGVFAMTQEEENTASHIFQLAINRQGILRGNYYNAVADSTELVSGSVDKKTQRAAWTVGDRKTPVYEAGIANLTEDQTTMLVHYGKERTQQWILVRIEAPEEADQR